MRNYIELCKEIFKRINEDKISELAAQCAYYTILSFVPFILLLISLIQYTGLDPQTLYNIILRFVPASMNEFVIEIVQEIYSKSIGTISISIIFTLWSAGKGVYIVSKGLKKIYKMENKKMPYLYMRMISIVETIFFILFIVSAIVALVLGNVLKGIVFINENEFLINIVTEIGIVCITFFSFILIYKYIPKRQANFKSHIPGAIISTISLNVTSYIFTVYVKIFKGFSIMYGSLTVLVLIMMWIYFCYYSFFIGAEMNSYLYEKRERNRGKNA